MSNRICLMFLTCLISFSTLVNFFLSNSWSCIKTSSSQLSQQNRTSSSRFLNIEDQDQFIIILIAKQDFQFTFPKYRTCIRTSLSKLSQQNRTSSSRFLSIGHALGLQFIIALIAEQDFQFTFPKYRTCIRTVFMITLIAELDFQFMFSKYSMENSLLVVWRVQRGTYLRLSQYWQY